MRALIQVADGAHVESETDDGLRVTGGFDGTGLVVLLGVTHTDDEATAVKVATKIAQLRILPGELSALQAGAPILLISQFTLYGDVRKGRRPGWSAAAPGPVSEPLYEEVGGVLRGLGLDVSTGVFGAHMRVHLVNDGPFTVWVDSAELPNRGTAERGQTEHDGAAAPKGAAAPSCSGKIRPRPSPPSSRPWARRGRRPRRPPCAAGP